ncbi:MAG: hypothetical protein Q4D78_11070 [Neisseria zoodegmatis]|nr:hypothetical protein [Neisseria zoodegmatis]MDO5070711.1 hypothetical protein [Neisseria zoodegmatis]
MTQQKIFNSSAALGLAAQPTGWLKFSKASVRADCISARNGLSQEAP